MQLDKTEIVIRQRNALELFDLSLVVLRKHFTPILVSSAILGVPVLLLDILATSWILTEDTYLVAEDLEIDAELGMRWRHLFHIVTLFILQFPLISVPTTVFLGNQIFFEQVSLKALLQRIRPIAFRLVWVLGVLRVGLLCLLAELFVNANEAFDWFFEFWILGVCGGIAVFIRACWPFAPEIIALELCPLRAKSKKDITYAKRSRGLHRLLMADHIARFIGCAIYSSLLVMVLVSTGAFIKGVSTGSWLWTSWMSYLLVPTCLWLVGLFVVVYRFLSYLDSRIRLEGWEIELRLRAEAARLQRAEQAPSTTGERSAGSDSRVDSKHASKEQVVSS